MSLKDVLALEQYSPEDWGAEVDYDGWSKKDKTSQVFIHWGGGPVRDAANDGNINSEKAMLRAWEDYHLNSHGWSGLAYDWAVGQSGTLYRVRGLARSAATSGDVDGDGYSNNVEGEAIVCIIGEGQTPSPEMLDTLTKVVDALGYDEVFPHHKAKGTKTACPGPDLTEWVDSYNGKGEAKPKQEKKKTKKKESSGSYDTWEYVVKNIPTLKRGGPRSSDVKRMQHNLALASIYLKADGIFGPLTERGVVEYQEKFGLEVDGIAGPKTLTHLYTNASI